MKLIEQIKSKDIFSLFGSLFGQRNQWKLKKEIMVQDHIQWRVWIIDEIKKGAGAYKLGNMIRFESFGNDDESKVKDEEIRRKVGGPGCLTSLLSKKQLSCG